MEKELCKCGHAKNEHVAFWKPVVGVKEYCWCDCENFRPTKRAVDEGDSAPLQAESTPEHLPIEEADTTPALRN